MFLISEKPTNVRLLKELITAYKIFDEDPTYKILFYNRDSNVIATWVYDSKDERDRVLNTIDEALGHDGNTGMRTRKH